MRDTEKLNEKETTEMAKHYTEKEIAKWTVNDLIAYMDDHHRDRFGIDYQPFGGWAAERGRIGQ